jgi:hypothetical protein
LAEGYRQGHSVKATQDGCGSDQLGLLFDDRLTVFAIAIHIFRTT